MLDAIGTFVAAYLATVPEAQHMKPAELQQALTSTFRVCLLCLPHCNARKEYIMHRHMIVGVLELHVPGRESALSLGHGIGLYSDTLSATAAVHAFCMT